MVTRRRATRPATAISAAWGDDIFTHVSGEGGRMDYLALGKKLKLKGTAATFKAVFAGALQDDDRFQLAPDHLELKTARPIPESARLDRLPVVIFDFETSGSVPGRDRAIELGMVAVENGRVTHEWESLFDPEGAPVHHYVLKMTGIKAAELRRAPAFDRMAGEVLDFLGHDVLIAHNLAFDKRFLDAELGRATGFTPLNHAFCSFQLARRLLPNLDSKGVEGLCNYFGIDPGKRHRALDDTRATAQIWLKMIDICFDHRIETFGELWRFLGKPMPGGN